MRAPERVERSCRENVIGTYLKLAEAHPSTRREDLGAFQIVSGRRDLSFCNFAIDFRVNSEQDLSLLSERADPSNFWAFQMPGDEPEDIGSRLHALGFQPRQTLVQMSSDHVVGGGCESTIEPAGSYYARAEVASFMSRQFFWRLSADVREAIALSTVGSNVQLYGCRRGGRLIGGLMLSQVGDSIGLYNVCVDPAYRKRGIGAELVRFSQERAEQEGCELVLQCETRLVRWYESLGFRSHDAMVAFKLLHERPE